MYPNGYPLHAAVYLTRQTSAIPEGANYQTHAANRVQSRNSFSCSQRRRSISPRRNSGGRFISGGDSGGRCRQVWAGSGRGNVSAGECSGDSEAVHWERNLRQDLILLWVGLATL